MTRIRHIALVVLLLLGGQMAAAAIASAACCCPAMAGADAPAAPCASLSALGCCEAKAQTPPVDLSPAQACAPCGPAWEAAAPLPIRLLPAPPPVAVAAERALRHTILRL